MRPETPPPIDHVAVEEPVLVRRVEVPREGRGSTGWWVATLVAVVAIMGLIFLYSTRTSETQVQATQDAVRAQATADAATAQAQAAALNANAAQAAAAESANRSTQAAAQAATAAADRTSRSAQDAATDAAETPPAPQPQ